MITFLNGDALEQLRTLSDESVNCCVTSPPYWGLRDYGVSGQIGLEKTPEEYVQKMVEVFKEVRRVLRDHGTCWVNLGDSYASDTKGSGGPSKKQLSNAGSRYEMNQRLNHGLKPKNLVGIPWRVAFALQADGWYLRQDIIWHKPNPMPESVRDRCTKAHEYIFLLTKSARYWYDAEAVSELSEWFKKDKRSITGPTKGIKVQEGKYAMQSCGAFNSNGTINRRSVWTITTQPYPEAHFATFPEEIPRICILAGCPSKVCAKCGAPWERVVEVHDPNNRLGKGYHDHKDDLVRGQRGVFPAKGNPFRETVGFKPTCTCNAETTTGTVLDPFAGSGTTGKVALELGRKAILIELNEEYLKLSDKRTTTTLGLGF